MFWLCAIAIRIRHNGGLMQATGSTVIKASREKVWSYLTNPDFVAKCAPGLESMEVVEENKKYRAIGSVGLGNLKVRFSGEVEFVTMEPPNRAVVKGRGTAPGSIRRRPSWTCTRSGTRRAVSTAGTSPSSGTSSTAARSTPSRTRSRSSVRPSPSSARRPWRCRGRSSST